MMQYVQWNEQPSWTFTNARVRSTEARSSAAPSRSPAVTASTPESVGQRGVERRVRRVVGGVRGDVVDPQERLELREERGLVVVAHEARADIERREGPRVQPGRSSR